MVIPKTWVGSLIKSASKTISQSTPGPDPWCLWRQEVDKFESDVAYVAFTRLVAPFCMITTALSLLQAGWQVSLPFVKPGIHWILISFPIEKASFV